MEVPDDCGIEGRQGIRELTTPFPECFADTSMRSREMRPKISTYKS